MMRKTAPTILVPISRLMQQQHASNFVQCDTGPAPPPPPPAPESPMSGIISVCALHYGQVFGLIWTKLQRILFTGSLRHSGPRCSVIWHRITVSAVCHHLSSSGLDITDCSHPVTQLIF